MAKLDIEFNVTKVAIIFFPIATYTSIVDAAKLTVFGVSVYQRVGDVRKLFGVTCNRPSKAK